MSSLLHIITSPDAVTRNQSLDAFARAASLDELLAACAELDTFRRQADNLYERVRALFFLYALHRFHIPKKMGGLAPAPVPQAPSPAHTAVVGQAPSPVQSPPMPQAPVPIVGQAPSPASSRTGAPACPLIPFPGY